jgi:hypothetical protein
MLTSVDFDGFKGLNRIQLLKLASINYLVGENNSGKSRVLQSIYETHQENAFYLDNNYKEELFLNNNFELILSLNKSILIIDEPENHLHPKLQKLIPEVLRQLANSGIQTFVATHSPFVISGSASITYEEKERSLKTKKEFEPSQKVYFMAKGQIAGRNGNSGVDEVGNIYGAYGYWGFKASSIAQKMLGAGLMDLIAYQKSTPTHDSPYIILCEGEGRDEDAKVYNQIFGGRKPIALFISGRGNTQLTRTFELLQEIRAGLSTNFRLLMLKDRDHYFANDSELSKFKENNPGVKVLKRRAIECYLYSSETLSTLLRQRGLQLEPKDRTSLNKLQRVIQQEAEEGVLGSSYKTRLRDLYKEILVKSGYWVNSGKIEATKSKQFILKISQCITPGTKTYRELHKIIFD